MHFELARGVNPAAMFCLVQHKIKDVYDRMLNEVKRMIILVSPERILLDFEGVAIGVGAGKFLGMRRIFAQISANLPEKNP